MIIIRLLIFPLLTFHTPDFFHAQQILSKCDRRQVLNMLDQMYFLNKDGCPGLWFAETFHYSSATIALIATNLASIQCPLVYLSSLWGFFSGRSVIKDGYHSLWLAYTFSTFSLKMPHLILTKFWEKTSTRFYLLSLHFSRRFFFKDGHPSLWLVYSFQLLCNCFMDYKVTWKETGS